ncbi:uncharacterized protein LOC143246899 [Tachypleus tridentatus]|uniref:uncharacterized protein LOC143246899 n=1 Tax=Tachypleus tridentatus TaxID=6853 RepID=UPI003FD491A9
MRLLKKRSPSPPQLIRLATLPGEDATHGSLSTKVCFSLPNIPSLFRLQDMPGAAETSTKPIRGRKQFTPLKYAVSVETAHPSRVDQPSLDCGSSQWTRPNVDHRQKDFTTSLSNMWGSERWVGLDAENRKPNARCTVASRHQPYSALSPNQRTSIYQIHWEKKFVFTN